MALKIVVDNRESREIISILESLGVDVSIMSLDTGDYSPGEGIFVERKTGQDLVNSLMDGRLFEQLHRLKEASDIPIMILEDFGQAFLNPEWEMRKKHVFGALSYLTTRLFVTIIPTNSKEETAILLERLCSWFQEEKTDPMLHSRGVKKSMSFHQKQEYLIQGLPGIGNKMSQLLFDHFKTPFKIFQAFMETEVIRSKSGRIKGLKGPLADIKGIGPKMVLTIQEILTKEDQ